MKNDRRDNLQKLLGEGYRVEAGTYYEVYGPDEKMAGHYDEELDIVVGHARVLFNECDDHSEQFLLELGRRAIEEHSDTFEARGFEVTDDDSVIFDDGMGRESPYYAVGIQADAPTIEEAADKIRALSQTPIEFELDVGL